MSLNEIYRKPFKKASVFLYPLLGISQKANIKPDSIWIAMENHIELEDKKLICVNDTSVPDFEVFSNRVLVSRKNFLEKITLEETRTAYVFDFGKFETTWKAYLNAKYSQFDEESKKNILKYFNYNSANVVYLTSYLYPVKYFKDYARILDVDINLLKEVGELCSKPDFESEKLTSIEILNI
jgi:hypothetical protein